VLSSDAQLLVNRQHHCICIRQKKSWGPTVESCNQHAHNSGVQLQHTSPHLQIIIADTKHEATLVSFAHPKMVPIPCHNPTKKARIPTYPTCLPQVTTCLGDARAGSASNPLSTLAFHQQMHSYKPGQPNFWGFQTSFNKACLQRLHSTAQPQASCSRGGATTKLGNPYPQDHLQATTRHCMQVAGQPAAAPQVRVCAKHPASAAARGHTGPHSLQQHRIQPQRDRLCACHAPKHHLRLLD
jgi:hypothetical protein